MMKKKITNLKNIEETIPISTLFSNTHSYSLVKTIDEMNDEEKHTIAKHINLSQFENPWKVQRIPSIDVYNPNEDIKDDIYLVIKKVTTFRSIQQLKTDQDHLDWLKNKHKWLIFEAMKKTGMFDFKTKVWKSGVDKRGNGEVWTAPNDNTFRVTRELWYLPKSITIQSTYDFLDSAHIQPDTLKMDHIETYEDSFFDTCLVEEQTRINIEQIDPIVRRLVTVMKCKRLPSKYDFIMETFIMVVIKPTITKWVPGKSSILETVVNDLIMEDMKYKMVMENKCQDVSVVTDNMQTVTSISPAMREYYTSSESLTLSGEYEEFYF